MKKTLFLLAALLSLNFVLSAQINVTLKVDMSQVTDMYQVSGTVWVYMDNDWSEYYTMTDSDTDGIFDYTIQKTANESLTYKFAYQNGPDEMVDYVTENVSSECTNEGGFRFMTVPAIDTVITAPAFGSCSNEAPSTVNITFSVDMSNETVLNNDVQVVIKNPWIWTALTNQGNGIWSAVVEVPAGGTYPYTFVNGGQDNWSGEEKVDAECNFGTESAPERRVTVADSDVVLETVEFGKCGSVVIEKQMVTFRVNMSNETVSAEGVQVVIKNPWIWTTMMDKGNGIWEATVELSGMASYPYSYVNGAKDYWSGEETIIGDCKDGEENQRIAVVDASDLVLPAYVFGTCNLSVDISDDIQQPNVKVFPNPVSSILNIELNDDIINSILMYDISGSLIDVTVINNQSITSLNVSDIKNGVYFLVVKGQSSQIVKQVVVFHN